MFKKIVIAFALFTLVGFKSRGAGHRASADRRCVGCFDDQNISVHRQRHILFARPEHQPCRGLGRGPS